MLKGAVARRYAEAVFELGSEPDTLDAWLSDVKTIADYFSDHQLRFILSEPNVRFERKEGIVRDLLTDKVRPEGLGLALSLVESGIVALAPRVRDEFVRLYNERRGLVVAQVTSATELDDAMRASITRQLEQMTGKKVTLEASVDPALLGGVIVRVGDNLMDGSVRRRLELLRRRIAEGGDLGGSMDGLEGLVPSDANPGDSAAPAADPPAGPASATSAAPRDREAPRLAPREPRKAGNPDSSDNPNNRRGKRRGR